MRSRTVDINGINLLCELQKRGLNTNQLSKDYGYCKDYITRCIRTNKIGKTMKIMLEKDYGIYLDPVKDAKEELIESMPSDLENVIYRAVFRAFTDALNTPSNGTENR